MNISSRCEYACRAILELARCEHDGAPISASTIAERRGIPEKYLVHILLQLKRAGLVRSVRGAQGGYQLGQSAKDISLYAVVAAVDGPLLDPLPVEEPGGGDLEATWRVVATRIQAVLEAISIRDIIDQATQKGDMYYI